jgi:CheY-like chemotaxis protein
MRLMEKISVLVVEDNPLDTVLIKENLGDIPEKRYTVDDAATLAEAMQKITAGRFDVILLDLGLPDSKGFDTVRTVVSRFPQSTIIVLTGLKDEQLALQAVRHGAQDYLEKNQISPVLLRRSISYAVERKKAEMEKENLLADLTEALERIEQLQGILPICAACKRIRNSEGGWEQIEVYLKKHANTVFSHGICPNCLTELYPDMNFDDLTKNRGKK